MNKQAILETVKELARLAIFGAISALVTWLTSKVATFDPTTLQYIVGTVILRAADKYVHNDPSNKAKGILPF